MTALGNRLGTLANSPAPSRATRVAQGVNIQVDETETTSGTEARVLDQRAVHLPHRSEPGARRAVDQLGKASRVKARLRCVAGTHDDVAIPGARPGWPRSHRHGGVVTFATEHTVSRSFSRGSVSVTAPPTPPWSFVVTSSRRGA